ncbi:phosphoribosylformylglycinamidine synthase subunit PurS [bacterium]|nr:phosphoribosylformylglycinamidine synthase subunit PurS [bacterium]
MTYEVYVNVLPLKGLLDPQGKTVHQGLNKIGLSQVADVRVGKRIVMHIDANSEEEAKSIAEDACKKVLVNPVMEGYEIEVAQNA